MTAGFRGVVTLKDIMLMVPKKSHKNLQLLSKRELFRVDMSIFQLKFTIGYNDRNSWWC